MEDKILRAKQEWESRGYAWWWLGGWREANPKFVSISQAALDIGLRSALSCSAVKRGKVEAGRQAFLMAVASPS